MNNVYEPILWLSHSCPGREVASLRWDESGLDLGPGEGRHWTRPVSMATFGLASGRPLGIHLPSISVFHLPPFATKRVNLHRDCRQFKKRFHSQTCTDLPTCKTHHPHRILICLGFFSSPARYPSFSKSHTNHQATGSSIRFCLTHHKSGTPILCPFL